MTTSAPDTAAKEQQAAARTKVGKSGHRRAQRESSASMIDRLLLNLIDVTLDGKRTRVPALTAIMLQLLQKGIAGDSRARRVMLQYQALASKRSAVELEVVFVDSPYTQSLSDGMVGDDQY